MRLVVLVGLYVIFEALLIFRGGGSDAPAEAVSPGADGVAEADCELFDLDSDPLGCQEMSQFVEKDNEAEPEHETGDGDNVTDYHDTSLSSTSVVICSEVDDSAA
jgi:hypothetical protein